MKHPFQLIDLVSFKKVSSLLSGNYKTSFHGSGIEFSSIREYSLGDDTTDIDWKASARTGKTYIKKYEEDRERKVLFVVDTGSSMRFGSTAKAKQDTLSEAFSLLLFSSVENNDPSGAFLFSDNIQKIHKIEKGMRHLGEMYDSFMELLDQDIRAESNLPAVVGKLCEKRIKNHLIFFFSDSLDFPKEEHFRSLAAQNDCIFIHIFDSFENTLKGEGVHFLSQRANIFIDSLDLKKQERYIYERTLELENFRRDITRPGGSYLALDESKNIYKELYLFFKKRQSRGL